MTTPRQTIGDLLRVRGAPQLLVAAFLGSTATIMTSLSLSLLVLDRFGSPGLAGLAFLLSNIGLLLGPFSGTLMDRWGRKPVILADFAVSIAALATIGVLALTGALSPVALLLLSGISGITSSLSFVGLRTAVPGIVPAHLLDMATGMTFNARALARVVGPLAAGLTAAWGDPAWSVILCAGLYLLAATAAASFREARTGNAAAGHVLRDTGAALRLMYASPVLRRSVAFASVAFFGWSAMYGALAPLVEHTMHLSPAIVGVTMSVFGVADVLGGLLTAHRNTKGAEWRYLALGATGAAVGLFAFATAHLPLLLVGAALVGFCETPVDHAIHVLRQRSVDPSFLGRVVAVGTSLSFLVESLGVAFAGFVSNTSPVRALVIGGAVVGVAAVLPVLWRPDSELKG